MSRQAADPSTGEALTEVFAEATISFERFLVPNFIRVKDMKIHEGFSSQKLGAVPLSGVPVDILDKLVGYLVDDIYAKAGRPSPNYFVNSEEDIENDD